MLISDGSSDVCSSDLVGRRAIVEVLAVQAVGQFVGDRLADQLGAGREQRLDRRRMARCRRMAPGPVRVAAAGDEAGDVEDVLGGEGETGARAARLAAIGRASCRERVCQYV